MTNTTETNRPTLAMATDPERALVLAPNFQPDVDLLIRESAIVFGTKGSGKTNLLALIVEQMRRYLFPQVIFDTEREQQSLLKFLPHGVIATANRCPSAYDIIHRGLQVIIDLQSWETEEAAALAMCQLINELFVVSNAIAPQDRYPCAIHLDEAAYWLPQDTVSYLSKDTRKAVLDAFHKLATRGRKQGLTPFLYTQSISEVRKETIRQAGIQILMRQTLDTDLDRYCEYIYGATSKTRALIRAYPRGKAVVILPDSSQIRVQFNERQSEHVSHTPLTQTAIKKFAQVDIDVDAISMRDMSAPADQPSPSSSKASKAEKKPQTCKAPRGLSLKDWVYSLLDANASLTNNQLSAITKRKLNTVQQYRHEYFAQHPEKAQPKEPPGKMERTVRAMLAENPQYTASQIAHSTNYNIRQVKLVFARIQGQPDATQ